MKFNLSVMSAVWEKKKKTEISFKLTNNTSFSPLEFLFSFLLWSVIYQKTKYHNRYTTIQFMLFRAGNQTGYLEIIKISETFMYAEELERHVHSIIIIYSGIYFKCFWNFSFYCDYTSNETLKLQIHATKNFDLEIWSRKTINAP